MRPRAKGLVRSLAVALVLVGLLGGVGTLALRPVPPPPTVGMVRTTEIKIQPEVSGRVAALPLRVGDPVSVGDVLAELSNPELKAALEEARAAVAEAKAARARVYAGVRQEEVNIAAGEVDKSKANLTLAKQELTRYTALASKGHASLQE